MSDLTILGVVGSLRKDSFNHRALTAAQALAPANVQVELVNLHGIPIYNQDSELSPPGQVVEFRRRVLIADAVLFATPEYNYSIPGGLKNAIDWGSRPYGESVWQGKPAAVMGVSVGAFGTIRAQLHLRQILVALNMPVVNQPEVMIGNAAQRFDADGRLSDEPTRQFIHQLLLALVSLTQQVQAG